jgi:hypothetical protein
MPFFEQVLVGLYLTHAHIVNPPPRDFLLRAKAYPAATA